MANKGKGRTETQKQAQWARTRANKIKRIGKMLEVNPNNQRAQDRLQYWQAQK